MYGGSNSLLDGPDGPLHLAYVFVGSIYVEDDGCYRLSQTLERSVSMYVRYMEAAMGVCFHYCCGVFLESCFH